MKTIPLILIRILSCETVNMEQKKGLIVLDPFQAQSISQEDSFNFAV